MASKVRLGKTAMRRIVVSAVLTSFMVILAGVSATAQYRSAEPVRHDDKVCGMN